MRRFELWTGTGVSPSAAAFSSTPSRTYGLHASSGILFNHESPRRGSAGFRAAISPDNRDISFIRLSYCAWKVTLLLIADCPLRVACAVIE